MFDDTNQRIGLKPAAAGERHAYNANNSGSAGSKKLTCNRMLVEHGIKLKQGLRFTDIEIDPDGFITLDLRTAVINRLSVTRQLRESQKPTTAFPAESSSRSDA